MTDSGAIKGKAIVTGGNGGIGQEICESLLRAGYKVVVTCRPQTAPTVSFKEKVERYGSDRLCLIRMDLSSEMSIRAAARQLVEEAEPIDIVVNNAGMMGWTSETAENGFEKHVMVNGFGPILFTRLLHPLLHKGSRVVNTVSVAMWIGKIRKGFPFPSKRFNRFVRYSDSKLLLQLLSSRLAEEWRDECITVNTFDPGIVDTPIIRLHNFLDPLVDLLFRPFIRTPHEGADTCVYLALDPSLEGQTGRLFKNRKEKNLKKISRMEEGEDVWKILESLVKR